VPDWTLRDPGIWRLDTYRVPPGSLSDESVLIDGEEGHHAADVVRVRRGAVIRLIDGEGVEALASVEDASAGRVRASILETRVHQRAEGIELTVCQALLKGRSFDEVVRRCSELGVSAVIPLVTERTLGRVSTEAAPSRVVRWSTVATAATKQSRGVFVPKIERPVRLDEVVSLVKGSDLALVAWEEEARATLFDALSGVRAGRVMLIVGPEGGLAPSEVERLSGAGALAVSVGRRILRADWAAAAISAMISHQLGGLLP
jgi:16S rRNA (uracil1498-N3)-methyltransferase